MLNEGENCICKASGNSMMLSEVVIDVAVLVDDGELLIEEEFGGSTVKLLAEIDCCRLRQQV